MNYITNYFVSKVMNYFTNFFSKNEMALQLLITLSLKKANLNQGNFAKSVVSVVCRGEKLALDLPEATNIF